MATDEGHPHTGQGRKEKGNSVVRMTHPSQEGRKSKKSKCVANLVAEVVVATALTSVPPSGDSLDGCSIPMVHNSPVVSGDADPLPPIIAAA